ncbi:MAG: cytochrome c biogenesis protein ResB [Candidatus Limnocylindrales bacterium]
MTASALPLVRRRTVRRRVRRLWQAFISVRVANGLLLAIAAAGVPGIVVSQFGSLVLADPAAYAQAVQRAEARYGPLLGGIYERLGLYQVFTTGWFGAMVLAFTLSLAGNTIQRAPRIWRDVRRPSVRRPMRFYSPGLPGRTDPLVGLEAEPLASGLRAAGYAVASAVDGDRMFLLAERHRWSPLASLLSHAALGLFVLGMGVVTPRFGSETILKIPVGEVRPVGFPGEPGNLLVRNEEFVARWNERNIPLEFRSRLTVFRDGVPIADKDLLVNDPLSVAGYTLHPNFFGPAVEVILRDETGQLLYEGAVVLDGRADDMPEGLLRIPGTDAGIDFLLRKGEGGVAELLAIGLGPSRDASGAPEVLFQVVLRTGEGYLATEPLVGVEFVRPSSYIGLIAKQDPGQGLIWLGGILLVTGLTVSLGFPRRRLWIVIKPDETRVVASGSGPFVQDEAPALLAGFGARPRYG